MDYPDGILVEEQQLKDLKERQELENLGYKIVKQKMNENQIKIFEDDKTVLTCNKEETVFRVLLLNSTIIRIMVTDKLTSVIIFLGRRVRTYSYVIGRKASLRGLRESYTKAKSFQEFLDYYIKYLNENNDERTVEWLKQFLNKKEEGEK